MLALVLVAVFSAAAQAAPADLDPTFGSGGKATLDFRAVDLAGYVALTPDGHVVVVGSTAAAGGDYDYAVARFTAAGAPDSSFGSGGKVTLGQPNMYDIGRGVAVQPDEKIVVTGTGNATTDFVTYRLNPDGSPDTSFGTGGSSVVDFGGYDIAGAMTRQADGKFVIVGETGTVDANSNYTAADFAITRLNADGTLDMAFGTGGKQTVDFGGIDEADGVAVQPDGKIVVTGSGGAGDDLVAARLNPDGSLDPSFGSGGKASVNFGGIETVGAVALQGDGKIVIAGGTNSVGSGDFAVARLNPDGTLDPTFSGDGEETLGYAAPNEAAAAVAVQQNGKIVVLGNGDVNREFVLTRLNPDGSIDTSFGTGGSAGVGYATGAKEEGGDLALQPDGKLVIGGSTGTEDVNGNYTTSDVAVARLQGDPVTGGGTGGGTGTEPPPPPVVHAAPTPPANGPGVVVNTKGTTGATRIEVGIGGCKPIFNGPASLPFLRIVLPGTALQRICVIAVGPTGATSSTTLPTPVRGSGLPAKKVGPLVQASASPALPTSIAPHAPCDQAMVVEALIDARGCLILVQSLGNLPANVQQAVSRYYKTPNIPDYLQKLCASTDPKEKNVCSLLEGVLGLATFISYDPVHLNGLTITPRGGSPVVIYTDQNRVFATNASVALGPIPLQSGQIDLDLTDVAFPFLTPGLHYTRILFSFDPRRGIGGIGGFPINGGAQLGFSSGSDGARNSVVSLHVTLPPIFSVFRSGNQPSAAAVGLASNDHPFNVDTADITVPQASLAGIGFTNLRFHYAAGGDAGAQCPRNYWKATGNIDIGPSGSNGSLVQLAPPPPENGLAFCQGGFKSAGGTLNFIPPAFPSPPELFPGVLLNAINFYVGLNPTLLRGGITISALDLIKVNGTMIGVFATPRAPFTLTKAEAGPGLSALAPVTLRSTSFGVGGNAALVTPLGDLDFGGAAVLYSYPGYFAANAHVNVGLGIYEFDGSLALQANAPTRLFEVALQAHICTRFIKICAGGLGIISSRGACACFELGPLHPGVGVSADGHVKVWLIDGCKPSHYWVTDVGPHTRARAAAGSLTFDLARGETVKNVKLAGVGGAPKILVRGPGGQSLTIAGDDVTSSGALVGLRSDHYAATWIGIKNGTPGRYTISVLPGSVALGALSATRPGYDNTFTGHLTRSGSQLVLHYNASRRGGGQQLTFFEDGHEVMHKLGTSSGGVGTLRFTPAPGAGGVRTIVARATVDGVAIHDQTIARFPFAGTSRTGRPGPVTVQRRGTTLVVSWRAATGAVRYGVVVQRSGGEQQPIIVSSRHLRVRVHAPLIEGGTVSVSAQGMLGDWGPGRRSARFKATRRLASMFRSPLKKHPPKKHKH